MGISYGEILNIGINRLEQEDIRDAKLDAELLLLYFLNEGKGFIYAHRNDSAREDEADGYFELVDRRASGVPLQYITGSQEFMGHGFIVNSSVLIPRQDTETLVEHALKKAEFYKPNMSILDMCCGSGAIAVSMAYGLPKAKILACDVSKEAVEVAARNISANGLSKRVTAEWSDMFETEKHGKRMPLKGKFDMILCNPPYIPSGDIDGLQIEIRDYEPRLALDGGEDGMDFYRIIAKDAAEYLKKGGCLIVEIGADQGDAVSKMFEETGKFTEFEIFRDLGGKDRVVSCVLRP